MKKPEIYPAETPSTIACPECHLKLLECRCYPTPFRLRNDAVGAEYFDIETGTEYVKVRHGNGISEWIISKKG